VQAAGMRGALMSKAMQETTERAWLSPAEASRYTGLDRVTLWRARKRGELLAGGAGRAVRFERTELDRWMRSGGIDDK
jgi:excisionase family DNA binding protein